MKTKTELSWSQFESNRLSLESRIASLGSNRATNRPKPNDMSPAEVYEHLAAVEESYLEAVESRSDAPAKASILFGYAIKRLRSGILMPAMTSSLPKGTTFEAAKAHFSDVRMRLRGALESVEPGKSALQDKALGRLSANQVMELCDAHLEYHNKRFPKV